MTKSVIKKILEEAAAKGNSRPVLKCIHYENGGPFQTNAGKIVQNCYTWNKKGAAIKMLHVKQTNVKRYNSKMLHVKHLDRNVTQ